jgi:glutathione S-transferase
MRASIAMIEQNMLRGPWVMGETYTVCDPYMFTVGTWAKGDGVDLDAFPKVAAHRERMKQRPAVQKVLDQQKA